MSDAERIIQRAYWEQHSQGDLTIVDMMLDSEAKKIDPLERAEVKHLSLESIQIDYVSRFSRR